MSTHISILGYFLHAGFVVKSVMFILLIGSVLSWTYMIERARYFRSKRQTSLAFLNRFWRSSDLSRLYADLDGDGEEKEGTTALFYEGFKEYWRRKTLGVIAIEPIERMMQIVYAREVLLLEERLPFFASVGSIAPYIGLFGTVWGIMTSFQALGLAQQATIAMVAPGISEALVATALGLFTAIPAVMVYNHFTTLVNQQLEQYDLFQQEFIALIEQQMNGGSPTQDKSGMYARTQQAKPLMTEVEG